MGCPIFRGETVSFRESISWVLKSTTISWFLPTTMMPSTMKVTFRAQNHNELNMFFPVASGETRIPIDHLLKKEGVMLRCHPWSPNFTNVLSWELLSMSNDQEALVYIYMYVYIQKAPGSGISSNVFRQSF